MGSVGHPDDGPVISLWAFALATFGPMVYGPIKVKVDIIPAFFLDIY